MVSFPSACTASTAATRPLIAADPIFRAPRPEIVSLSNFTGADVCATALHTKNVVTKTVDTQIVFFIFFLIASSFSWRLATGGSRALAQKSSRDFESLG